MSTSLILPLFCHVALTALLYVILSIVRAPSIWNIGANKDGTNPYAEIEKRVSANLSNQFEWPLFFYAACMLLMMNDALFSQAQLWLAVLFLVGRIIHSLVHILTNNIRLRGIVFTLNFLAVFAMWVLLIFRYFNLAL